MAPLSVNWQVKSLKASRILFDENWNETVEEFRLLEPSKKKTVALFNPIPKVFVSLCVSVARETYKPLDDHVIAVRDEQQYSFDEF